MMYYKMNGTATQMAPKQFLRQPTATNQSIESEWLDVETLQDKFNLDLSEREIQVLTSLLDGLTYKAIGRRHFISVNTVKTYQKRIYSYFGVGSRFELMAKCKR